ncbi:MAG: FAD-linked oxidase C-terminal domain-containing protein [bacterium]|nr:FAD-linked oxidase C-terminal domain-containing protein [bacterium]
MISDRFVKEMKNIVGNKNVLSSREECMCYSYDATGQEYLADLVVRPITKEEISQILVLANKEKIAVYPRGAATGMTGGCLPINGGLVIDLTRMNKIMEIDTENFWAIVEPGVITADLQTAAEEKGLFYPPDPASNKTSTIGGNIAESAGGLRGLRYGTTKDYVLSLEMVLPTGEIINLGSKTLKSATGYNLISLIVGSEGTLGIITKAVLKLLPQPECTHTLLAAFKDKEVTIATIIEIIKSKIVPAALEFMDRTAIQCVKEYFELNTDQIEAALIIEVDGREDTVEKEIRIIEEITKKRGATTKIAKNVKERNKLWLVRKSISPAIYKICFTKVNEDICIPRTKIVEMLNKIEEISKKYGIRVMSYGHAGDGNFHINILTDKRNKEEMKKVEKAIKEIFTYTIKIEGTLSGEHGIGNTKSKYLNLEIKETEMELMKKIKNLFDPANIMNPGKIFYN